MSQQTNRETTPIQIGNGPQIDTDGSGPACGQISSTDAAHPEAAADSAEQIDEKTADERDETLEEAIARLEAELIEAKAQSAEAVDRMKRTVAEYENAGKRRERQSQERIERATEGMIYQLLPVLDDLELAFQNLPERAIQEDRAWLEGFEQIHQKLLNILADAGVELLAKDGEFDPTRHEAISHEPHEDIPSGHIIQTLRAGYQRQERVLRPALVRVAQ